MHENVLDEQRALVDLIEREGWDVTETDVSVYESPWEETDAPEATVTITARKVFADGGDESENDDSDESRDGGDDSPYRVN